MLTIADKKQQKTTRYHPIFFAKKIPISIAIISSKNPLYKDMKKKKQKPANQKFWQNLMLEAAVKYYEREDRRRLRNLKKLENLLKGKRK